MTAIAIFALSQRSDARNSARRAHARELSAQAFADLDFDPQHSLVLALDAARLEQNDQIEELLRQALLRARLRRVFSVGGPVAFVGYGPNDSVLAARKDGLVTVRDARSGRLKASMRVPAPLSSAEITASGSVLAAGGNRVRVRTPAGRLFELRQPAHIASASFARGGSIVLTTANDGRIRLSRPGGGVVRVLREPVHARAAAMSADGLRIAAISSDRNGHVQTRLYDAASGRLIRVLPQRGVSAAVFDRKGGVLATTSHDGTTVLWRARNGKLLRTLDDEGDAVVDAAFSPDDSMLATASRDGAVRVWTVASGERLFLLLGHSSPAVGVAFDPNGEFVVSASEDRTARLWKVSGIGAGGAAKLLAGHHEPLTDVAVAPDGRTVATGSEDGTVRVWDARLEQELSVLRRQQATPALVVSSADSTRMRRQPHSRRTEL
jgi:WD40 repeat protein